MADSAVAVTAGSGTNIDTRTEATNGNHRAVVVIGDPSTNAGVAPVDATNGLAVDVKAVVPGTAATALGKAEDAAHGSGDVGVMALAVRANTAAATGANGDYVPLLTDANGCLHTAISAALPAGTAAIGEVKGVGITVRISAAKTRPNDTTAYAAGDVVNESDSAGTEWIFDNCARANGGSGVILGAHLVDSGNKATKGNFELWLFRTAPGDDFDNAVFTPTDAELLDLVGIIPFTSVYVGDATSDTGNCVYIAQTTPLPFVCDAGADSLYGVMVVRNAYTPIAQEVFTAILKILQD